MFGLYSYPLLRPTTKSVKTKEILLLLPPTVIPSSLLNIIGAPCKSAFRGSVEDWKTMDLTGFHSGVDG